MQFLCLSFAKTSLVFMIVDSIACFLAEIFFSLIPKFDLCETSAVGHNVDANPMMYASLDFRTGG